MKPYKLLKGNGIKTVFPFRFKISSSSDLSAYWVDSDNVAHALVLGNGITAGTFTASVNSIQDLNPGGTITTWAPIPVGGQVFISRNTDNTTLVNICNIALARLGDEAAVTSINPPDSSPQARYCAMFLPMSLSSVLDEHNWCFTIKVTALDLAANNDDPRWLYCYVLPEDYSQVISVFGQYTDAQQFTIATNAATGQRLFTNQAEAYLEYSAEITDPNLFPSAFTDALAWKLAVNLAGPIIKGDTGAAAALKLSQAYQGALKLAKESDGQGRKVSALFNVPTGIAARA